MGLIIVALAVLGTVLAVGSARGGLAPHQEARFVRDGVNESGAALASMEHDYDYAHDVGRFARVGRRATARACWKNVICK